MATEQHEPEDTEAEYRLLAMTASAEYGNVAQECAFLLPEHFYVEKNRQEWTAARNISARGEPVESWSIWNELKAMGQVGPGRSFESINEITEHMQHLTSAANAKIYARSIWETAMKRKMRAAVRSMSGTIFTDAELAAGLASMRKEYEAVEKEIAADTGKRKRLISDEEAEQMPPIEYVIDEWLPVKSIIALYGDSGAWKTYQVLSMLLSIPTSQAWHGYSINKQGPTVYVAAEAPETIGERVHAWKQHYRIHGTTGFYMWTEAVNLLDAASVEDFISTVRAELPTVPVAIAFDTLALSMDGGDPNLDRDINLVYGSLRRIRDALDGPSIMFVDHEGKDSTRGMSGSAKKRANADVVIRVQKQQGGQVQLKREKMRGRPEDEDGLYLRRIHVPADESGRPGQLVFERAPERSRADDEVDDPMADLTPKERAVLDAVAENTWPSRSALVAWMKPYKVSKTTTHDSINRFKAEGWIIEDSTGLIQSTPACPKPSKIRPIGKFGRSSV